MKRIVLILVHLAVGLSALAGGISLIVTNGLGMYPSAVQPLFYSYTIPGLILAIVVGGTNLLAVYKLKKHSKCQHYASATAGYGLIIWIFAEVYITNLSHLLQIVYFGLGISMLVLTMFRLKKQET